MQLFQKLWGCLKRFIQNKLSIKYWVWTAVSSAQCIMSQLIANNVKKNIELYDRYNYCIVFEWSLKYQILSKNLVIALEKCRSKSKSIQIFLMWFDRFSCLRLIISVLRIHNKMSASSELMKGWTWRQKRSGRCFQISRIF